jgi:hypothetical protein
MNLERLRSIITDLTVSLGKTTSMSMSKDFEDVDCHVTTVRVFSGVAARYRDEIIAILNMYPEKDDFYRGLSYQELVTLLRLRDDHENGFMGLRLFALGEVLGLWDFNTPKKQGDCAQMSEQQIREKVLRISPLRVTTPNSVSRVR